MFIGAHIKKEKTLLKTLQKINQYNGNALQFFTKSPQTIEPANISKFDTEIDTIIEYCNNHNITTVIHSAYIVNIATPCINDKRIILLKDTFWYNNIINDLIIAHKLGSIGVVVHVGKSTKQDKDTAMNNMITFVQAIIKFIDKKKLNTTLILETGAGQGTEMLVDLNELIQFYNLINRPDVFKLCFDTAHVWAAGYDIIPAYTKIQEETDNAISVIHMNGSKVKKGSKKDRHETIFSGEIDLKDIKQFITILNQTMPSSTIILETPTDDPEEIAFIANNL